MNGEQNINKKLESDKMMEHGRANKLCRIKEKERKGKKAE